MGKGDFTVTLRAHAPAQRHVRLCEHWLGCATTLVGKFIIGYGEIIIKAMKNDGELK